MRSTPSKHQGKVRQGRRRRLTSTRSLTEKQSEPATSRSPKNCRTTHLRKAVQFQGETPSQWDPVFLLSSFNRLGAARSRGGRAVAGERAHAEEEKKREFS
ncbi:non-canonical purine NTP pyrophosphatase [Striga asiatica]|uniref:Non-canonical purine NTP pyrophosphatase n=1 Tax=Striga asiatica TaxID=4170 RepID=A0A5A7QV47_STRAF|nr:non-canonical purine NTP pyrophosphatase [Striga asiatica]